MDREHKEFLRQSLNYFKNTEAIFILRQVLMAFNPKVEIAYDPDMECIWIDNVFTIEVPYSSNEKYTLNKVRHIAGSYWEPEDIDFHNIYTRSSDDDYTFFSIVQKYYRDYLEEESNMALDYAYEFIEIRGQ